MISIEFGGGWARVAGLSLAAACLVLAAPRSSFAKRDVDTLREISNLEDRRSLGDGRLVELLADDEPETRAAAARALGRIGRTETVSDLIRALEDSNDAVRSEAIFALGQIGDAQARDALNRVAGSNAAGEERREAVIALGKLAGDGAAETVLPFLSDPLAEIRADAALAIARTADSVAALDLRPLLSDPDPRVRANAAWAGGRLKARALAPELRPLAHDPDPDVQLAATKAVGELEDGAALTDLLRLVKHDDWRIRVNTASSLGGTGSVEAYAGLVLLSGDENVHVRSAVGEAIAKLPYHYKRDDIIVPLRKDLEPQVRGAVLEAMAIGLENEHGAQSDHWTACGDSSLYVRRKALASFSNASERAGWGTKPNQWKTASAFWTQARLQSSLVPLAERIDCAFYAGDFPVTRGRGVLVDVLSDEHPLITACAIHALGRMAPWDSTEALRHAEQTPGIIIDVLENHPQSATEVDIRLFAAEALGNFDSEESKQSLRRLAAKDPDYRVRKEAADALEKLGEPRPEVNEPGSLPGDPEPLDDTYLKSKPGRYTATIRTNRGDIVIELLHQEAPRTVQNFVNLANDDFYDGLLFHRVVPNFVVQGGCPIGNGWGHPGYEIRCEYSPLRYERGMVGMAHAGKDTGGSQFFITHSPQPHLDGRYTIFGRVIEGMDVVDAVRVEDVIESIDVKKKLF